MELYLVAAAFSLVLVLGGCFVLLVAALLIVPRLGRKNRKGAPVDSVLLVEEPRDSVIIDHDYEKEAHPERMPVYDTPVALPALGAEPELIEIVELGDDDSFELLFDETPPSTRVSNLDFSTRAVTPLPMPIAPAGVEPIPELEPTEIITQPPYWMEG